MWFKVDDKFHSHSKVRKVLADDPAALALWVVAGSWSSDNLEDGFVPDHQLPWLIPAGADALAQKLVAARLWRRVRGGYQFHDFDQWNPTADKVRAKAQARAEAGRKGGLNSGKARSNGEANASASAPANAKQKRTPTRPDPNPKNPSSADADPEGWAMFWAEYPPRFNSSKADALKAYRKALKEGAEPAEVIAGARAYATERTGKEEQYTAHASTWLNGKRWEVHAQPQAPRARSLWDN